MGNHRHRKHAQGITFIIQETPKRSATMPKTRGPEGLGQGHLDLAAVSQGRKEPLGFGVSVSDRDSEKPWKVGWLVTEVVGGH